MPTADAEAASGSLILKDKGRPDHTLNQHPGGPTDGVHFTPRYRFGQLLLLCFPVNRDRKGRTMNYEL
jgi:hypothetical protein